MSVEAVDLVAIVVPEKDPEGMYRTADALVPFEDIQKLDPSLTTLCTTAPEVVSVYPELITMLSQASTVAIVRTFARALGDALPEDMLYPANTKYLPLEEVVK
jgi:hypothetical protein